MGIPNIRNAYGYKLSLEYELAKYFFGGPALVAKAEKWAKIDVLKMEATSASGGVESLYPILQPSSRRLQGRPTVHSLRIYLHVSSNDLNEIEPGVLADQLQADLLKRSSTFFHAV